MNRTKIKLALNQTFDIIGRAGAPREYRVSTKSYAYAIEDEDGEIVSFHYHPDSGIDFCHMHFRRAPRFGRAHFPSGRVAVEEVVGLAIRELGVEPRRSDYRRVLTRGLEKFREWRTWDSRGTV